MHILYMSGRSTNPISARRLWSSPRAVPTSPCGGPGGQQVAERAAQRRARPCAEQVHKIFCTTWILLKKERKKTQKSRDFLHHVVVPIVSFAVHLLVDVASESATSMLRVDGVRDSLVRALAEAGVAELTPVQAGVLPHCLAGQDVLAKAKTGTGKTLAFLVPTVERLLCRAAAETGVDPVRALVISSARELGTQIATQAAKLTASQPASFTIETIMGGSSITPQRERLDPSLLVRSSCVYTGGVDLMIATPGRLIEHINTTDGFSARLASCEVLVLDECDQLLDGGFQQDIEAIVAVLPAARQTLCFSATVPNKMLAVLGLAMRADFVTIDCVGEAPPSLIAQTVVVHPLERSLLALFACIRREMRVHPSSYKILAFLPTARQAQFCAAALQEVGCNALEIHSRRTASERSAASETFREQAQQVLLSSDVSARGVDYPDVSLVLQVGAPASRDVYVQRIGRTGRAGRAGASTLLLCEYETGFLSQLEGLPIAEAGCDGAADAAAEFVSAREAAALQEAAAKVPEQVAAQTYRAWVVAMNGQRKALKWSKADLVSHASRYARGSRPRHAARAAGTDRARVRPRGAGGAAHRRVAARGRGRGGGGGGGRGGGGGGGGPIARARDPLRLARVLQGTAKGRGCCQVPCARPPPRRGDGAASAP